VSMKGCPFACFLFRSTRKTPTDSCCLAFRSTRRPAGGCTGSLTVVARTRDELADCGGLEPMLAVATDQVVHGVGNLRQSCTPPSGFKKTVRPSPLLLDFRLHRTRSATGTRCLTKSPKPATTTMLMARCRISRDTLWTLKELERLYKGLPIPRKSRGLVRCRPERTDAVLGGSRGDFGNV